MLSRGFNKPGLNRSIALRSKYSERSTFSRVIFSIIFRVTRSNSLGMHSISECSSDSWKSLAYLMTPVYGTERKAMLRQIMSSHVPCRSFIWSGSGREPKPTEKKRFSHCSVLSPFGGKVAKEIHQHTLNLSCCFLIKRRL